MNFAAHSSSQHSRGWPSQWRADSGGSTVGGALLGSPSAKKQAAGQRLACWGYLGAAYDVAAWGATRLLPPPGTRWWGGEGGAAGWLQLAAWLLVLGGWLLQGAQQAKCKQLGRGCLAGAALMLHHMWLPGGTKAAPSSWLVVVVGGGGQLSGGSWLQPASCLAAGA